MGDRLGILDGTGLTMDIADEMAWKDNGNGSEGMQKQKVALEEKIGRENIRAEKRTLSVLVKLAGEDRIT